MRAALLLSLLLAAVAAAGDGQAQPAGGVGGPPGDGVLTINVGRTTSEQAYDAVAQPDGRLVVLGGLYTVRSQSAFVMRFEADGAVDSTFGTGGASGIGMGAHALPVAVTVQSDGRILVAATVSRALGPPYQPPGGNDSDLAAFRLLPDGSPDPSFGLGGVVIVDFGGPYSSDQAGAIAVQADGRILLGGSGGAGSDGVPFALARLLPDGSLDPAFGVGGRATFNPRSGGRILALAVQPDGHIVAGGYDPDFGGPGPVFYYSVLARFTPEGAIDPTFAAGGVALPGEGVIHAVALQNDGGIVAAGTSGVNLSDGDLSVLRFRPTGQPDPTFGVQGRTDVPFGSASVAQDVLIQPDGRIVAAGAAGPEFALARLTSSGSLDPTFDEDGRATVYAGAASALALGAGGRLVAVGSVGFLATTGDIVLGGYTASGAADSGWGDGGLVQVDRQWPGVDWALHVTAQGDGRAVAAGGALLELEWRVPVVRLGPDGHPDGTFGSGGVAMAGLDADGAAGLAVQPDGAIVVAATVVTPGGGCRDFAVARLTAGGAPDSTFGDGGRAVVDLGCSDRARALLLQPDGRVVVVGDRSSEPLLGAVRLNPDGSLDATFDGDGRAHVPVQLEVSGAALQPDGRILLVGGFGLDFAAARLMPDGALDPTFGTGGFVRTELPSLAGGAAAVGVQPDGRIVLGGWLTPSSSDDYGRDSRFALLRYLPDGTLDPSFGTGGVGERPEQLGPSAAHALVLKPDGRIVLAGAARTGATYDFALARYVADGRLDASFGAGGTATSAVGWFHDVATSVAILNDGRLLAAGWTEAFGGTDAAFVTFPADGGSGSPAPPGEPAAADRLGAPRPNPAGRTAVLDLTLARDHPFVVVAVHDVLGRRLVVLHDGPLAAGTHVLPLDASALPPGVYLVRAAGASWRGTARLVVAR